MPVSLLLIPLVGSDLSAAARVAARLGCELAEPADGAAAAAQLAAGHADAILILGDGWFRIEGSLDAPAELPSLGGSRPHAVPESRRRAGPAPTKPRREDLELVADLLPERSLREIAEEFTTRAIATPRGAGKWHAVTVKRLLQAGVRESGVVLQRLGALLAELDQASASESELERLGRRHRFHHQRLYAAFEAGYGAPYHTPYQRPVERVRGRYRVSPGGRALLERWNGSLARDDRVEQVLLALLAAGRAMDADALGRACAKERILPEQLPADLVAWREGHFALTDAGAEAAETWRAITDRDPRRRLDADFWPRAGHESNPAWDWADPPSLGS